MRRQMAAELATLAHRLDRLAELDWKTRDFTRNGLRDGLAEVIACFPVYRTYIAGGRVSAADRAAIERAAVARAAQTGRADPAVLAFIRDVLLLRPGAALVESRRPDLADFVLRFQQYTAALMAKGIEDTAFYRHHRLAALNEVGGDPGDFAADPGRVHRALAERAHAWPHAMLATATHDAKRGEDVRRRAARAVRARGRLARGDGPLAPPQSAAPAQRRRPPRARGGRRVSSSTRPWSGPCRRRLERPDADFAARMRDYLRKAAREAKRATSWWQPDDAYERALDAFVEGALGDRGFLDALAPLRARIARLGALNALAQCLLKLTAPGVPDLYQGAEAWQLALVDPDNRRAVDFDALAAGLDTVAEIERLGPGERRERIAALVAGADRDGLAKQLLVRRALAARRRAGAALPRRRLRAAGGDRALRGPRVRLRPPPRRAARGGRGPAPGRGAHRRRPATARARCVG
ncbi:MAG: hypothetical protein U5K43_08105 [Halofilum sp. (in: g-proteobacteria)]|nr:hypothetical protein [Halofilum sp. (in: g-proteobacteria)]